MGGKAWTGRTALADSGAGLVLPPDGVTMSFDCTACVFRAGPAQNAPEGAFDRTVLGHSLAWGRNRSPVELPPKVHPCP